jgi:hypothetical protein
LDILAVNCGKLDSRRGVIYARKRIRELRWSHCFRLFWCGWFLAIVALSAIRENYDILMFLALWGGLGITFILTGLMAIAFMSFMGFRYKSIIKLKMIILGINSTTIISSVFFTLQFATCLYNSVCQIKAYSFRISQDNHKRRGCAWNWRVQPLLSTLSNKKIFTQPAVAVVLAGMPNTIWVVENTDWNTLFFKKRTARQLEDAK